MARPFRIDAIEAHDRVIEKIERKHAVILEDVEEACAGVTHVRRVREGRYLVLGRTDAGRLLACFLARDRASVFRLISARDMTDGERFEYERHTKKGR